MKWTKSKCDIFFLFGAATNYKGFRSRGRKILFVEEKKCLWTYLNINMEITNILLI